MVGTRSIMLFVLAAMGLWLLTDASAQYTLASGPMELGIGDSASHIGPDSGFTTSSGEVYTGLRYLVIDGLIEREFGPLQGWGLATEYGTGATAVAACGECDAPDHVSYGPATVTASTFSNSLYVHPTPVADGDPPILRVDYEVAPSSRPSELFEVFVNVTNIDSVTYRDLVWRQFQRTIGEPTTDFQGHNPGNGEEWIRFDGIGTPPPGLLHMTNNWPGLGFEREAYPARDPFTPAPSNWNCIGGVGQVIGPYNAGLDPWTPPAAATVSAGYPPTWIGPCNHFATVGLYLGNLTPAETRSFRMYVGAAEDYSTLRSALVDVGAEFWYASTGNEGAAGTDITFAWGFSGFEPPRADFDIGANPVCRGDLVTFFDRSTIAANLIRSTWDFGDSTTTTLDPWAATTTHTYPVATGPWPAPDVTYSVTLNVTNKNLIHDEITKTITVADCRPPPPEDLPPIITTEPGASCLTATEGRVITFDIHAYDPNEALGHPEDYYILQWQAKGLPRNATFNEGQFSWRAVLGEYQLVFRVSERDHPELYDEVSLCIRVDRDPSAPTSTDTDGDGEPDGADTCPAEIGCGAYAQDKQKDASSDLPPAEPCTGLDLLVSNASAQRQGGRAVLSWHAPEHCYLDRFLVWNGTDDLLATVPYRAGATQYTALDFTPSHEAHRYHIQAEVTPGPDVFHAERAVPVELDGAPCQGCILNATTATNTEPPPEIDHSATTSTPVAAIVTVSLALVAALVTIALFVVWKRRRDHW